MATLNVLKLTLNIPVSVRSDNIMYQRANCSRDNNRPVSGQNQKSNLKSKAEAIIFTYICPQCNSAYNSSFLQGAVALSSREHWVERKSCYRSMVNLHPSQKARTFFHFKVMLPKAISLEATYQISRSSIWTRKKAFIRLPFPPHFSEASPYILFTDLKV